MSNRPSVLSAIKGRAFALLPDPVYYWLRRYRKPRPPRSAKPTVKNLRTLTIDEHVRLEVYWLDSPQGTGPAASLYVGDEELLRLDCFGGTTGHMHLNLGQTARTPNASSARFYFPAGTVEDHIQRAAFEVKANTAYCQRVHRDPGVRELEIDVDRLSAAADDMSATMLRLLAERPAPAQQAGDQA